MYESKKKNVIKNLEKIEGGATVNENTFNAINGLIEILVNRKKMWKERPFIVILQRIISLMLVD